MFSRGPPPGTGSLTTGRSTGLPVRPSLVVRAPHTIPRYPALPLIPGGSGGGEVQLADQLGVFGGDQIAGRVRLLFQVGSPIGGGWVVGPGRPHGLFVIGRRPKNNLWVLFLGDKFSIPYFKTLTIL